MRFVFILFSFSCWSLQAQKIYDTDSQVLSFFKGQETLSIDALLGKWIRLDLEAEIEFKTEGHAFLLERDSFFRYLFIASDTGGRVMNQGVKILWPPYYCYIRMCDTDTLEVLYKSVGVAGNLTYTYRRKKND